MSEIDNRSAHELVPTTNRSAELLANAHSFASVESLAASLPLQARVIDLGAGDSPFGSTVAALRPDITWTNFDLNYRNSPEATNRLRQSVPGNVDFVAGDIMKLTDACEPESFDVIFSYWLFPHLSLESSETARRAAKQVFAVAKPDALISIGPVANTRASVRNLLSRRVAPAKRFERGDAPEEFANKVVDATQLVGRTRLIQKTANEVATPYFGTTRYVQENSGKIQIYDPISGEYKPLLSRRSIYHLGNLVLRGALHINRIRKTAL